MRRNAIELMTGVVVLIVAVGFLVYAIAHSGTASVSSGYPLYANFNSIAGLGVGADVRLAGVKVGSVDSESVDPKTYLARVKLTIRDGIELPKDTGVTVTSESLLGGEYLALSPGGDSAMLQPGDTIAITQGTVSLQELLGKFIFGSPGGGSPGGATGGAAGQTGGGPSGGPK